VGEEFSHIAEAFCFVAVDGGVFLDEELKEVILVDFGYCAESLGK
jgi:hypothetical protein